MSNLLFPKLPGQSWPVEREPQWATEVKTSVSGVEYRAGSMFAPAYLYKLQFDVLSEDADNSEFQTLAGFFNQHRGRLYDFLFDDEYDNTAVAQQFGLVDGVATQFQLVRSMGGWADPVYELHGVPTLYANSAVISSGYTISKGRVTFTTLPATGSVLTWSGQYYWRMRFVQDKTKFSQFMRGYWENKTVELITVKPKP